jgi:hypothetical protein
MIDSENVYLHPSCAIDSQGHVWCWGHIFPAGGGQTVLINSVGKPLNGASPYAVEINASAAADDVLAGATQVSSGDSHVCVIAGTQVKCWGSDTYGALGLGTPSDSDYPVVVPNLPATAPTTIGASNGWGCVLVGGQAYCWGSNGYGQGGTGTPGLNCSGVGHTCQPPGPAVLTAGADGGAGATLSGLTSLYLGYDFGCAIKSDASLWCWGNDGAGASNYARSFPAGGTPISNVTLVTSRSSGSYPSLIRYVTSDGAYHVGNNQTTPSCL